MRDHPLAVFKHPELCHVDFALDMKVTPLAEGSQVPPGDVALVVVQVVNGEGETVNRIVRMTAAFALVAGLLLYLLGDLRPVWRIFTTEVSHLCLICNIPAKLVDLRCVLEIEIE